MSSATETKVLFCGDVCGRFDQLFKRITTVNSGHGPFDCVFCVGPFFGEGDPRSGELAPYLSGERKAPLPVYFTEALPAGKGLVGEDGVVCPGITFLKSADLHHLHNLKVAVLPGRYDELSYKDGSTAASVAAAEAGEYRQTDVAALKAKAGSATVDVLLTNEWPRGVLRITSQPPAQVEGSEYGSPGGAEVAEALKPRYHVAGGAPCFYLREPYKNPGQVALVTRFVGLAPVGNSNKQKWMHALSLQAADAMPPAQLYAVPAGTTNCPYTAAAPAAPQGSEFEGQTWRFEEPRKRQRIMFERKPLLDGDPSSRIFIRNLSWQAQEGDVEAHFRGCGDIEAVRILANDDGRSKGLAQVQFTSEAAAAAACALSDTMMMGREIRVEMADGGVGAARVHNGEPVEGCWFCMSNPQLEAHLVTSIGEHTYQCLDKGAIIPQHVLLLPIEHLPNTLCLPDAAFKELDMYLLALKKCFADKLGSDILVMERFLNLRHKRGGNHLFLNVVPISRAAAGHAVETFQEHAKKHEWEFQEISAEAIVERADGGSIYAAQRQAVADIVGPNEYLVAILPDGTVLLHIISRQERHPMNFGREVMADVLGCPERSDWKTCSMTTAEEEKMAADFKALFEPYDPFMA